MAIEGLIEVDKACSEFDYAYGMQRLSYTIDLIEGYNGLIRWVIANKGAFTHAEAVRKLPLLANCNIRFTLHPASLSRSS